MPNRNSEPLFLLIKSLEKAEKRNFKLYIRRNSNVADLKIIQLFDGLDKMTEYDEKLLLKKYPGLAKAQLSNLKARLHKELLTSLRLLSDETNVDIQLNTLMSHARILYNRGLYLQTLKMLEKFKETARAFHQLTYLQQAIFFEKKIEALFITRSFRDRAQTLSEEADQVSNTLSMVNQLSNLSLKLYSWYIEKGFAKNNKELEALSRFYNDNLPQGHTTSANFYVRMYYCQASCWHAFLKQDFLLYYKHTRRWADLFHSEPAMIQAEPANYIKGMHNLMGALFNLMNAPKLRDNIRIFEQFSHTKIALASLNNRILTVQYLYTAKINQHFLEGTFTEGLELVPDVEAMLQEFEPYLDTHRTLIFYYKIACLYFGAGNNEKTIDYLNLIINRKGNLRTDLQCYARLLHLLAHYELGNFQLLEYLMKSVYRFMFNMDNLSKAEEAIFKFLRSSLKDFQPGDDPGFEKLLASLEEIEKLPGESRAFVYLDFISWLESKIQGVDVQDVIRQRYLSKAASRDK